MTNNPVKNNNANNKIETGGAGEVFVGHSWLYDHIGRICGGILGLLAFFGLAFLAVAGSKSALGLLVIIIFGVFVIAVGSHMRGK